MSALDKFLKAMKLNDNMDDDEYDDDDDEYLDDENEDEAPAPRKSNYSGNTKSNSRKYEDDEEDEDAVPKKSSPARSNPFGSKITPMRTNSKKTSAGGSGMEVCVIKPSSFEEAREITETLLKDRTIVMNLEGLDVDVAQRILDFTSGSCFAIGGNLQKISMYIFILTPASVDVSGDFQNLFGGLDSTLHTLL